MHATIKQNKVVLRFVVIFSDLVLALEINFGMRILADHHVIIVWSELLPSSSCFTSDLWFSGAEVSWILCWWWVWLTIWKFDFKVIINIKINDKEFYFWKLIELASLWTIVDIFINEYFYKVFSENYWIHFAVHFVQHILHDSKIDLSPLERVNKRKLLVQNFDLKLEKFLKL